MGQGIRGALWTGVRTWHPIDNMFLEVIGHREAMTTGHNSHICHPGPFTLTLVSFSIAAEKILPGAEREGS